MKGRAYETGLVMGADVPETSIATPSVQNPDFHPIDDSTEIEKIFAELEKIDRALGARSTHEDYGGGNPFPDKINLLVNKAMLHWEIVLTYDFMHNLECRERVSERLAVLLAKHWPNSFDLWVKARDFFSWQPPASSDTSSYGQALRQLFDAHHQREISQANTIPPERAVERAFLRKLIPMYCLLVVIGLAAFCREYLVTDIHSAFNTENTGRSMREQFLEDAVQAGDLSKMRAYLPEIEASQKADSDLLAQAAQQVMPPLQTSDKRWQIIRELTRAGFPANVPLKSGGASALDSALSTHDVKLLETLFDGGLSPNALTASKEFMIFVAIDKDRLDLVSMLCAYGVDLSLRNDDDETPLAVAIRKGNKEMVELLRKNSG
jgi:hypothetical protein